MSLNSINGSNGPSQNYVDHKESELDKALELFRKKIQKGELPQGFTTNKKSEHRTKRRRSQIEQSIPIEATQTEKVHLDGTVERYEGDFKEGKRSGTGKLTIHYAKGPVKVKVYSGEFAEGFQHGPGAVLTIFSNGTINNEAGKWFQGKRVND